MSFLKKLLSVLMICNLLTQAHAECKCKKKIIEEDEDTVVTEHLHEEEQDS